VYFPLNILIVGELRLEPLARNFSILGHEVTVLRSKPVAGNFLPEVADKERETSDSKIKFEYLPEYRKSYSPIKRFYHLMLMIRKLRKLIRKNNYDVIRSIGLISSYASVKARQNLDIPIVANQSDFYSEFYRLYELPFKSLMSSIIQIMEKKAISECDLIFVDSPTQREYWKHWGLKETRCVVVPNGVLLDFFNPNINGSEVKLKYGIENDKVVFYHGDISRQDGIDVLISAAPQIAKEIEDVKFMVVGSGTAKYMRWLKEKAEKEKLTDYFIFTGWVNYADIPNYIAAADVCVAPFRLTLTSNSNLMYKIIEYIAMTKPIVASRSKALNEMLGNVLNYVKPEDPHDLARAVIDTLHNEEFNQRNIKTLLSIAQRLSYENIAMHQEKLLEAILNQTIDDYRAFDYILNPND
jgi:glycosyltransferase involved in cell wall biosynthesis